MSRVPSRRLIYRAFWRWCGKLGRHLGRHSVACATTAFTRSGNLHEAEHCRAALAAVRCQRPDCSGSILTVLIPALEAIGLLEWGPASAIAIRALTTAGVWDLTITADSPERPLEGWLRLGRAYIPDVRSEAPSPHRVTDGGRQAPPQDACAHADRDGIP